MSYKENLGKGIEKQKEVPLCGSLVMLIFPCINSQRLLVFTSPTECKRISLRSSPNPLAVTVNTVFSFAN